MTKVLMTGMTSQHCNPETHRKRMNFVGLIRDAFRVTEDEVYWSNPSVEWDDAYLKQFDAIIVGVAPLSSLGANRAYGALNVIGRTWNSGRLTLLVDAPDAVKVETSVQAVLDHPENLIKDFFRYRKEYRLAREKPVLDRLITAAYLMRHSYWPRTIYPELPWQPADALTRQMRNTRFKVVNGVNLDSCLFELQWTTSMLRTRWWAYESSSDVNWLRRQNVCWTVDELLSTHRLPTNQETIRQLAASRGTLIAPAKAGTWWTPRYALSLAQGSPVFSDWQETSKLHSSWSELPTRFEMMTDVEKGSLLTAQSLTYQAAIGTRQTSLDHLYSAINLGRKVETWMVG